MCDCYDHQCKGCGRKIPMHLADFDTGQDEIEVWCGECQRRVTRKPYVVFDCNEPGEYGYVGRVTVVSLTSNAARNADGNHPNLGKFTVIKQVGFPKRKIHPRILDWMGAMPKALRVNNLKSKTLVCPNCGGMKFDFRGPSGGGSQNISCRLCGAGWKDTPFGMECIATRKKAKKSRKGIDEAGEE